MLCLLVTDPHPLPCRSIRIIYCQKQNFPQSYTWGLPSFSWKNTRGSHFRRQYLYNIRPYYKQILLPKCLLFCSASMLSSYLWQSFSLLRYPLLVFPVSWLCTSLLHCHVSLVPLLFIPWAPLLSQLLSLSLSPIRDLLCPEWFLYFLHPAAFPSCLPCSIYHCLRTGSTCALLMIQRTAFSIKSSIHAICN